jgi:hypothetical protein
MILKFPLHVQMEPHFDGASLHGKFGNVNPRSEAAEKDFSNGLLNSTPVLI